MKPNRLSLYAKQVLRHFNVSIKRFHENQETSVAGYTQHIVEMTRRLDEAKDRLAFLQSLKPGDMFFYKAHINYRFHPKDNFVTEGIVHFNFFASDGLSVSFVAGDKAFLKHLQGRKYVTSLPLEDVFEYLLVPLYMIKNWKRIYPKDLPLYVSAENKSPYFEILLKEFS
jgi:hypothetical protein